MIRNATPEDVPAIHALIVELAIYEREPQAVVTTPLSLKSDLFEAQRCHALVAEQDNEIIGFALYFYAYSTWKGRTLYLEDLYVKASKRTNGVGQQLFDAVVQIAQKEGVKRMDWQVLSWNQPAILFYQKNQAILDHEWVNGRLYF